MYEELEPWEEEIVREEREHLAYARHLGRISEQLHPWRKETAESRRLALELERDFMASVDAAIARVEAVIADDEDQSG
jgi:hypothetical protein